MYGKAAVKWELPGPAEKEFSAVTENTQKPMNLKPSKGCFMWRINIKEVSNYRTSESINIINIKGKVADKSFTILVQRNGCSWV